MDQTAELRRAFKKTNKYNRLYVTAVLGSKENLFISIKGEPALVRAFWAIISEHGGKNLDVRTWHPIK